MAIVPRLTALGIDINDQESVIRLIRKLAITDKQKTDMLTQYLAESHQTLSIAGNRLAIFLTPGTT